MVQSRDRDIATISPNPSTRPVSASRESEGTLITILENSPLHYPVEKCMLHIKIQTDCSREALYSANHPHWVRLRVRLERTNADSNIATSSSRDLVCFDRVPSVIKVGFLEVFNLGASDPSDMALIALNLHKVTSTSFKTLFCTIDNDALSGLFLVVTDDSICDLAKNTKSDEWGFREIAEADLRARRPQLYANGQDLVKTFKKFMGGQKLDYMFVFDWDRLGMK
ncbi:hypothetical protein F4679DRAFT_393816 [Xylaria curta]|nr:hypothetical protein F4679DRAFT_393816 [Xylaria curta]